MDKIWLSSYEQGVNHEIDLNRYESIIDLFEKSVKKFSHLTAFYNAAHPLISEELTYEQVGDLARDFAAYLQNELHMKRGDRIAIMMPNVLQYPIAVFGALKAGLVVVNTNPLYTPRELEHQLKDSGATTIVVLENFANTLEMVLPRTEVQHVIVASIGDMFGLVKGGLLNFMIRKVKKLVPNYQIENAVTFTQALNKGAKLTLKPPRLSRYDLAFLQYTGGTTGVAKGAMLTHGNICANLSQAAEWIKNKLTDGEEVVITALPLYHILAMTLNLMMFFQSGAKNILITNPRDFEAFIAELKKHQTTVFIGVNTLFNSLLSKPEFEEVDFSTWHLTVGGGMSTQRAVAQKWAKVTGIPIVEAYGLTEASPGVCVNPLNIKAYSGGIGLPIPSTDAELRDGDGKRVAIGQAGELWIKGPQVMKGYWNRPDETAKVLDKDGWLATGDIAVMDEKGWLKIVDRKKDLIVVSGFNVYPNEVEEVVAKHPKVQEVACIGIPSEQTGEALKLFVVKRHDSLTREELIDYCRTQLTGYKVPRDIEFRDELPKSNVGKILRRELRDKS